MEKGMLTKRFICEHQVLSGLDKGLIDKLHKSLRQDVKVLQSFTNLQENMMYTVIDSHDRLTVESFFSDHRVPWNSITEVELQCEGRSDIQDLRGIRLAA